MAILERSRRLCGRLRVGLLLAASLWLPPASLEAASSPTIRTVAMHLAFDRAVERLETSISANDMLLVARARASAGAAARGISIQGNAVLEVFRNDYAVRMLRSSIAAGIEAPLRLYVTEGPDGRATFIYRLPSHVFAPYGDGDLTVMARELDAILAKIVEGAAGR